MRITRTQLLFFVLLMPLISSCKKDQFAESKETSDSVSVSFVLPETKTALSADRTKYQWTEGDSVSIFNNKGNSFTSLAVSSSPVAVQVPSGTTELYAVSPCFKSAPSPSEVAVTLPLAQAQLQAGVLSDRMYPFWAKSGIVSGVASLSFSPLVAVFAFNVYKSDAAPGEKIESVTVTPLENGNIAGEGIVNLLSESPKFAQGNSGNAPVTVVLENPADVSKTAPSSFEDKIAFPTQLYMMVAKQSYASLQFDVNTSVTTYKFVTSSPIEASDCSLVLVGLNLSNGKVIVDVVADASLEAPSSLEFETQTEDRIPDFSTVGYHYGDREIPSVKEVKMIGPKLIGANLKINGGAYNDTTEYIQAMIDSVGKAGGGAIRLTKGTFNVSRILFIDYDNVVLRGTTRTETILLSNGKMQRPAISIGKTIQWTSSYPDSTNVAGRRVSYSKMKAAGSGGSSTFGSVWVIIQSPVTQTATRTNGIAVSESFAPTGRNFLEVSDASQFSVGDFVSIYRPSTPQWISDIGMDKIASNGRDDPSKSSYSPTQQWTERNFDMYWDRKIVAISGKRLYFDAPLVQSLDAAYGGGMVFKTSCQVVRECGVENMTIKSTYNSSLKKGSDFIDEAHTWIAVDVHDSEHCWVRDVDSYHMGYALVRALKNTRCLSVLDCNYYSPVSVVSGGRRYAFCLTGASLVLFKNCTMDNDRHGCVSNGTVCGPNVYTKCTGTNMRSVMGPHQSWANGTLYDCIVSSDGFETQDRGNYGTGHGWTSANDVFWNIEGTSVVCQDVWASENTPSLKFSSTHSSGHNFAVGVIGKREAGRNLNLDYFNKYVVDYYINTLGIPNRPSGRWYPEISVGASGTSHVSLPDETAAASFSWWPKLTLKTFSDPLSLYQCQLEDRRARGISYSNL